MLARLFALVILLLPSALVAEDWAALEQPGAIALMRHALAPGGGDPAEFTLGDCSTQRNLDSRGRAQARQIGAALRARGIGFDRIWSSAWCRAEETARLLALGPVEIRPALNSFFAGRGDRASQTRDTLADLSALPEAANALLVTHQVNITALTGVTPQSGEIIIVQRRADGRLEVTGRVNIAP
ncbi:MAG: histidine phosphatase family protein [Alphaproteobacteria bacterium]